MKITGSYTEIIECPECKQIQEAEVTHTPFWNIYLHVCIKCDFLIMESEWNIVKALT